MNVRVNLDVYLVKNRLTGRHAAFCVTQYSKVMRGGASVLQTLSYVSGHFLWCTPVVSCSDMKCL